MSSPVTPSPPANDRAWTKWIRWIGFGAFLLAALGLISYVATISNLTGDLESLKRITFFTIIVAFVLYVLDLARTHYAKSEGSARLFVMVLWSVASVSFLALAILFLVWVGAFVARDAGLLSPVRTEASSFLLRPTGKAAAFEIQYDPNTNLRRSDDRSFLYHPVQNPTHIGKLDGIYVEFGPGENEVDAVLRLENEKPIKVFKVRLDRTKRSFDFVD
jgi:hypothetical protein